MEKREKKLASIFMYKLKNSAFTLSETRVENNN